MRYNFLMRGSISSTFHCPSDSYIALHGGWRRDACHIYIFWKVSPRAFWLSFFKCVKFNNKARDPGAIRFVWHTHAHEKSAILGGWWSRWTWEEVTNRGYLDPIWQKGPARTTEEEDQSSRPSKDNEEVGPSTRDCSYITSAGRGRGEFNKCWRLLVRGKP